jgi:hypothetical protein
MQRAPERADTRSGLRRERGRGEGWPARTNVSIAVNNLAGSHPLWGGHSLLIRSIVGLINWQQRHGMILPSQALSRRCHLVAACTPSIFDRRHVTRRDRLACVRRDHPHHSRHRCHLVCDRHRHSRHRHNLDYHRRPGPEAAGPR